MKIIAGVRVRNEEKGGERVVGNRIVRYTQSKKLVGRD